MDFVDFNQLVTIGGDIMIMGNPRIKDLKGMQSVRVFSGSVNISDNDKLINLMGFPDVVELENAIFRENDALQSFQGMQSVQEVNGNFFIWNNSLNVASSSLVSLQGLQNITSIGGSLEITYQALSHMGGLNRLETAKGIYLIGLSNLKDLDSLQAIQSLNDLILNDDEQLTHVNGLSELSSLQNLVISHNEVLNDLSGLENVKLESASNISITDNSLLTECAIQSICNAIESGSVPNIQIEDNASGCHSLMAVQEECVNPTTYSNPRIMSVYPNPATLKLYFKSERLPLFYTITSSKGDVMVRNQKIVHSYIQVDQLQPGPYHILLKYEDGSLARSFFVKM